MQRLSGRFIGGEWLRELNVLNIVSLGLSLGWLLLLAWTLNPAVDDFKQYWQAAVHLRLAGDPYLSTPGPNAYPYPPLLAYLLQPLSLMAHWPAQLLWFAGNVIALLGFITLCIRLSGSHIARRYWGVVILGTVLAPPTRLSLQLGQVSILLALVLLVCYSWAGRAPSRAGLLLALASIVKLYPAILGVLYLLRCRRVALWTCAWGSAIFIGTIVVSGSQPYLTYLDKVLFGGFYPYAAEFNISLASLWNRLFTPNHYAVAVADLPWMAQVLTILSSIGVLGACLWVVWLAPGKQLPVVVFSVWLCAMLLLSPINGYYNLVLLLLPLLLILSALERQPSRGLRNWLVGATALVYMPPGWSSVLPAVYQTVHRGWGTLILTPSLYGLIIFLMLAIALVRCGVVES